MAGAMSQVKSTLGRAHNLGDTAISAARGEEQSKTDKTRHGVTGQFSMMIRGAVALAVGVFIVSAIFGAIPASNSLSGAQTQVEDLTGQAFEIAPVVLIVLVAVLILQFVRDL
jgi:Na+/H+ antiporter NhaC